MRFITNRANEIYEIGKAKGLSIAKMCKMAGCNPSTFWRWRSGKITNAQMEGFQRLCQVVEEYQS